MICLQFVCSFTSNQTDGKTKKRVSNKVPSTHDLLPRRYTHVNHGM